MYMKAAWKLQSMPARSGAYDPKQISAHSKSCAADMDALRAPDHSRYSSIQARTAPIY